MKKTHKCMMYAGTYTSGDSEGIYTFELDTGAGGLKPAGNPIKLVNPSYLVVDRSNRYLYSVIETDEFNGIPGGAVAAFAIDKETGRLEYINCQSTKGRSACHINIDSTGKCLFTANYGEGKLTVFPLRPDGGVEAASCIIKHQGAGPDPIRQVSPHAHYVTLTPDEKYLCAVDLGIDKVIVYSYNRAEGSLSPAECFSMNIKPGCGPRHMEFSPDGRYAYLANELVSTIAVLKYSQEGIFTEVQYASTIPEEYAGINYPAAVHVSPDGKFLYVSNRGHDSIAVFRIDPSSGMVELISHTPTEGNFPRDFTIDPTGSYLFAANQSTNNIVPFKIDKQTGSLERLDYSIGIPSPVCIKFVVL